MSTLYTSINNNILTVTGWFTSTPISIGLTSPGHISSQSVARDTGVGSIARKGGSGDINHSIGGVSEDTTVNNYSGIIKQENGAM